MASGLLGDRDPNREIHGDEQMKILAMFLLGIIAALTYGWVLRLSRYLADRFVKRGEQ